MECSTACVPKNIDVHFIPINKISNLCNCSYKYVATCNVIYIFMFAVVFQTIAKNRIANIIYVI